jgi:hypothetical protein
MSKTNNLEENEAFLANVIRPKFGQIMEHGTDDEVEAFLGELEEVHHYVTESQALRKRWEDYKYFNQ